MPFIQNRDMIVRLALAVALVASLGCAARPSTQSEANHHEPLSALITLDGVRLAWPDQDGDQPLVMLFVSRHCPIANGYAPEINRLIADYREREIGIVLVYPEPGATDAEVREHARDYGFGCPVVVDRRHALVRATGVTITPEAALVVGPGRVAYLGRIDDRYASIGVRRTVVRQTELRDAIDAVLAGRDVPVQRAPAVGCFIEEPLQTR